MILPVILMISPQSLIPLTLSPMMMTHFTALKILLMCDDSPIDGDNSVFPFNSVFELYPYDDSFFKFTTCYVVKPHILVEPNLFQNQCHLSVLFVRKSINS